MHLTKKKKKKKSFFLMREPASYHPLIPSG